MQRGGRIYTSRGRGGILRGTRGTVLSTRGRSRPPFEAKAGASPSDSIVISGLPESVTPGNLLDIYSSFGSVIAITRNPIVNEAQGSTATVTFSDAAQAKEAQLKTTHSKILGAVISVELLSDAIKPLMDKYAQPSRPRVEQDDLSAVPNGLRNLYVCNVSTDMSEEELKEIFSAFGAVLHVCILCVLDAAGRRRAFVDMASPVAARTAIVSLNGTTIRGYRIDVSYAIIQRGPNAPLPINDRSRKSITAHTVPQAHSIFDSHIREISDVPTLPHYSPPRDRSGSQIQLSANAHEFFPNRVCYQPITFSPWASVPYQFPSPPPDYSFPTSNNTSFSLQESLSASFHPLFNQSLAHGMMDAIQQSPRSPRTRMPSTTVLITGLRSNTVTTAESIRNLLFPFGRLVHFQFEIDQENDAAFAIATYCAGIEAEKAVIGLHGQAFGQERLYTEICAPLANWDLPALQTLSKSTIVSAMSSAAHSYTFAAGLGWSQSRAQQHHPSISPLSSSPKLNRFQRSIPSMADQVIDELTSGVVGLGLNLDVVSSHEPPIGETPFMGFHLRQTSSPTPDHSLISPDVSGVFADDN